MRCQAITHRQERHQQVWRKDCENTASAFAYGVPLCQTHVNALARGPIEVRTTIETPSEFKR